MIETKNTGRGRPKKDFDRKYIRSPKKVTPAKTDSKKSITVKPNKIRIKAKKSKQQMIHKWLYIVGIFILALFVFSLLLDKYKSKIITEEYWKIIISNIPEDMNLPILWQESEKDKNIEETNIMAWEVLSTWIDISESASIASWISINEISETNNKDTNISPSDIEDSVLNNFYEKIALWEVDDASNMVDLYLKKTNTYQNYYTNPRINEFIKIIDNDSFRVKNIEKLSNNINKPNNEYYRYTLSYSIKNTLFEEQWEATIINRNGNKQIWRLECVSKWCSTMPFFNPEKYK